MNALLATIVDGGALLQTAVVAIGAGAGVTLTFSLAILGTTRATELRRSGRNGAAAAAIGLAGLALVVSASVVGLGLLVMIDG